MSLKLKIIAAVVLLLVIIGIGKCTYDRIYERGVQDVKTELNEQNYRLDNRATNVRENITQEVVKGSQNIAQQSREIEEVISGQPSENLSDVTRARLERMRDQQRRGAVPTSGR